MKMIFLLPTRPLRLSPRFALIGSPVTAEVRRNGPEIGRKASDRAALAGGSGRSRVPERRRRGKMLRCMNECMCDVGQG